MRGLHPSSDVFLTLLWTAASTLGCVIPEEPLSNNITEKFSIFVQNASIPVVHNRIMNFRPNGEDKHLVLRPQGEPTSDLLYIENGRLQYEGRHAVIDLEYNPADDTTKMFMTDREYHPAAIFQPVYGCDPDTDVLQIRLQLVSRLTDPPVIGGQIGIQTAGDTYEFRYTPPRNNLLDARFMPVAMVIFRDGSSPTPPRSSSSTVSRSSTTQVQISTTPSSSLTTSSRTSITSSTRPTTATTASSTPTSSAVPVGEYKFVSCWAEPSDGRALPAAYSSTDDMTLEKCAEFCSRYPYFGTEWGRECWCDVELTAGSAQAPLAECDYPCIGDSSETCGGSRRLSLYHRDGWLGPQHPSTVGMYELYGCVTDITSKRTLIASTLASPAMTLERCATFCSGFKYFGTEWSTECFCGNSFTDGATQVDIRQCSMTCGGDDNQLCGAGGRLSLYQLAS